MKSVAIVTGGTSGIGLATARALCSRNVTVYCLSRHPAELEGIAHLVADVSDEEQVFRAVEEIFRREGRIDILINNAGYGISGAAEMTDSAEARKLMDVNLFGMVNAARAVLPIMRKQGSGRIVFTSSVAAVLPIPFQAWYSVSKAAINAYSLALQYEVRFMGITTCAVMPGDIRTGFTAARQKSHVGDAVYQGRIARSVSKMEKDEVKGMAPETAGKFLAHIALKKRVKPYYAIGLEYKFFVMLSRLLPCGLIGRLLGMLYSGNP